MHFKVCSGSFNSLKIIKINNSRLELYRILPGKFAAEPRSCVQHLLHYCKLTGTCIDVQKLGHFGHSKRPDGLHAYANIHQLSRNHVAYKTTLPEIYYINHSNDQTLFRSKFQLGSLHQNRHVPLEVGDELVIVLGADQDDFAQQLIPVHSSFSFVHVQH